MYLNDLEVTMRPATLADEATLSALAERLGECPLPPWRSASDIATADFRAMMHAIRSATPDNAVFVAERDGTPVGCLHVLSATDFFGTRHAHLSVIAVSATAEGAGVGRFLMDYAERWTRERALPLLTLNVLDGNARARRLYERHGFAPELVKYVKQL